MPACQKASLHERRQRERVGTVLDAENAEKEAVHDEQNTTPGQNSNLLSLVVANARHLNGERDGTESQDTVYFRLASRLDMEGDVNKQIAATIWVSKPNWFWKPPAK